MKALVLAAGFGKRLKSITTDTPKALIKVADIPLIFYTLFNLKKAGINSTIINLHYMPEKIKALLGDGSAFNMKISYAFEPKILGTGGAIKNVEKYFENEKHFIIANSDIVSNINLREMIYSHVNQDATATLGTQKGIKKDLFYDEKNNLLSISKDISGLDYGVFTGIQIVNSEIFKFTKPEFSSSIETYTKYIELEKKIKVFRLDNYFWYDLGIFETLGELENKIKTQHSTFISEIKKEMKLV